MLGDISGVTNIYIITGYTDMRKSIDGLYLVILRLLCKRTKKTHACVFCCYRR